MPNLFRSYIKKREEAIKDDWEDLKNLSIKTKKILLIFIIQNISAFLFAILDKDLPAFTLTYTYGFILCFVFVVFDLKGNGVKKWALYLYSIIIPVSFLCFTHIAIFHNWDKNYSELISFSGETFVPKANEFCDYDDKHIAIRSRDNDLSCREPNVNFLYIQSENQKLRFSCSKSIFYGCDEVEAYFNKKWKDILSSRENLSVKYAVQQKYLAIPYITIRGLSFFPKLFPKLISEPPETPSLKQWVIYEISYQDKVIYNYEHFIQKYRQQRIKHAIYMIYLVLNSIVFIFIYRSIFQKAKTCE